MAEAVPYAEVIGDPVDHSLSPAIHNFWLDRLGLSSQYCATRCGPAGLVPFLATRRRDPAWHGCSVTMPLKRPVLPLLDALDPDAAASRAVNCIVPRVEGLVGHNTDVDGVTAALGDIDLTGKRAVVSGAGGGARAALVALARRGAHIVILARNAARREALLTLAPDIQAAPLHAIVEALEEAAVLINATPLGMGGAASPAFMIDGLAHARGTRVVDMVYAPLETELLAAARALGLPTADGLTMLIGQARRAFMLFFGTEPPPGDAELRARLRPIVPSPRPADP